MIVINLNCLAMKTLRIFTAIVFVAMFCSAFSDAQTMQRELVANFGEMYIPCLDRTIDGTWTAHFSFHLDKEGKIDRMHVNTWKSDFYDVVTGEEVRCFDTLNDNLGYYFWFMNNPNAANGSQDGTGIYNVDDGWLDEYMPDDYPFEEGTLVEMNWKFQIRGKKFGISSLIQIHFNAQGEPTATVEKSKIICSE